jgi:CheY-like chemotaxis protein
MQAARKRVSLDNSSLEKVARLGASGALPLTTLTESASSRDDLSTFTGAPSIRISGECSANKHSFESDYAGSMKYSFESQVGSLFRSSAEASEASRAMSKLHVSGPWTQSQRSESSERLAEHDPMDASRTFDRPGIVAQLGMRNSRRLGSSGGTDRHRRGCATLAHGVTAEPPLRRSRSFPEQYFAFLAGQPVSPKQQSSAHQAAGGQELHNESVEPEEDMPLVGRGSMRTKMWRPMPCSCLDGSSRRRLPATDVMQSFLYQSAMASGMSTVPECPSKGSLDSSQHLTDMDGYKTSMDMTDYSERAKPSMDSQRWGSAGNRVSMESQRWGKVSMDLPYRGRPIRPSRDGPYANRIHMNGGSEHDVHCGVGSGVRESMERGRMGPREADKDSLDSLRLAPRTSLHLQSAWHRRAQVMPPVSTSGCSDENQGQSRPEQEADMTRCLAADAEGTAREVIVSAGEAVQMPLRRSLSCKQFSPKLHAEPDHIRSQTATDNNTATTLQTGVATVPRTELAFGADTPKLRILVAEDNKINQLVVQKVLRVVVPTSSVTIVEDGEAAVQAITGDEDFDLVLMDLHMPKMGGLEASQRVRELMPRGPRIVALTADTVADVGRKCLEAGMNDYVTKPFNVNDMRRILAQLPRLSLSPSAFSNT